MDKNITLEFPEKKLEALAHFLKKPAPQSRLPFGRDQGMGLHTAYPQAGETRGWAPSNFPTRWVRPGSCSKFSRKPLHPSAMRMVLGW